MEREDKHFGKVAVKRVKEMGKSEGGEVGEKVEGNGFTGQREGGAKGRVRRATFADFDAIMDINDNVYEGLDYMPTFFYIHMHSKLHVIYVYEENGKLVALANFRFHPECDDLVTGMSGRVRASHHGRGLGSPLSSPIIDQVLLEHPKIKRNVGDVMYKPNIATNLHRSKILYQWNLLLYKITDRQWLSRCTHIRQMTLCPTRPFSLSYSMATEWLERSDQLVQFVAKYATDLFPVGHTWMPTPVSRSGLREASLMTNAKVSVSPAGTSAIDKSCSADLIPNTGHLRMQDSVRKMIGDRGQDDEIVGLSFSMAMPCKHGLRIDIQFFGDCENVFVSHVYSHLLHDVSMASDDVSIGVFLHFPLTIDSKNVEERLKEGMGKRIDNDFYSVTQAVQYISEFPKAKL